MKLSSIIGRTSVYETEGAGSIPARAAKLWSVVQLVEYRTLIPKVARSNRAAPTRNGPLAEGFSSGLLSCGRGFDSRRDLQILVASILGECTRLLTETEPGSNPGQPARISSV